MSFVPDDFTIPTELERDGYRLEPLGPEHNERDYEAWTSSIEHIKTTPGFENWGWPKPMTLEENMADVEMHARHFRDREGFTYSVLDGDEVIGCLYIYPSEEQGVGASVRSWVRAFHGDLDRTLWQEVSQWLADDWPFETVEYASR